MILLAPRRITIMRCLRGVKMHLQVPVENYEVTDDETSNGTLIGMMTAQQDYTPVRRLPKRILVQEAGRSAEPHSLSGQLASGGIRSTWPG